MLLRDQAPSWLYQVRSGATTVWERWDAIRPDGSIHPGTMLPPPGVPESEGTEGNMLSFNHYAYGAVVDWMYRHVAGIAPVDDQPGYRAVLFEPIPHQRVDRAMGRIHTAFGDVAIDWHVENDAFIADVEVPFGSTATFVAPVAEGSEVVADGSSSGARVALAAGRHHITVSAPRLAWVARAAATAE